MLKFSFGLHTVLCAFNKQNFLMLVCLDWRRYVTCLYFPLEKKTFELNFSAMETACCSAMHAHFIHCLIGARLDTSPRRDATSRSVNLFRELFQVFDMIFTKSALFVSEMLIVRSLELTHMPSWVRMYEHVVLKSLSMHSGLRQSCNSGRPRSVCRASTLQARASFRCTQMSEGYHLQTWHF